MAKSNQKTPPPAAPLTGEAPAGTETRFHDFTPAQLEAIKPALDQMQNLQQYLGFFFGYIQKEAKLPDSVTGWTLGARPGSNIPCLLGHVKK